MNSSWNRNTVAQPKVVITTQGDEFDQVTIQNWRAEGFEVFYLPFTGSREDYVHRLQHLADQLELGEKVAIIGILALVSIKNNTSQ